MPENVISKYISLNKHNINNTAFIAFLAQLIEISKSSTFVVRSIINEIQDQRSNLKLIDSENYSSLSTQYAMGNLLTDNYAEGYAYSRNHSGENIADSIEEFACNEACKLFKAEHANVQPQSRAAANLLAYWAILSYKVQQPIIKDLHSNDATNISKNEWNMLRNEIGKQKLLGIDYYSGGNFVQKFNSVMSAQIFDTYTYSLSKMPGLINYDHISNFAKEINPLIIQIGYCAYPREIDFQKMRDIADSVNAILMVDMSHFAGLVASGIYSGKNNPVPYADIITSTTHKTLRGPRGGMVLCKKELGEFVDKVCSIVIGTPSPQITAAKAVALKEANNNEFTEYIKRMISNAKIIAKTFATEGVNVITGGTDNHIVLISVQPFGITGLQAEKALRECKILLKRHTIPFDLYGPYYTSGLYISTPAITTLGIGKEEIKTITSLIQHILSNTTSVKEKNSALSMEKYNLNDVSRKYVKEEIETILKKYVLYPELDIDFVVNNFF